MFSIYCTKDNVNKLKDIFGKIKIGPNISASWGSILHKSNYSHVFNKMILEI